MDNVNLFVAGLRYTVVSLPIGQACHPMTVADLFDDANTLTLTDVTNNHIVATYPASNWCEAAVYDPDGYVVYAFKNPHADANRQAAYAQARAITAQFKQLDAERDAKKEAVTI